MTATAGACVVCGKPATGTAFCSDRCRTIDLMRWCDGRYAIVEELDPQVAEFLAAEGEIAVLPATDSSSSQGD